MSKTAKVKPIDLKKAIMAKVESNEIAMKPRWYFVLGSVLLVGGLAGLSVGAIFLVNLTWFLLRQHGPMGQWKLQLMLNNFPWWVPILAIGGIVLGIKLLKKFDCVYKKNIWLVIGGFVVAIILAAGLVDYLGLNDRLSRQGPMRRFYQQVEGQNWRLPGRGGGNGYFRWER
ncbi:MAG: hypothetical protein UX38_C0004G0039 [Microgenomates group bacterium GW2011_GWC1_46_16]|uniref:Uncharacterized protein n=2 Tax=Candidatus Collieribacteriota TaxID=1752725 RepID=A0A1F5FZR1_9BACT|nr:MAG: hypothetical protein UX38_C0004G0039 [Microgenomates group bacterium GW2011_GWC1_46_16]KKU60522.1 MAG: hypothetical protein UX82_C0010G0026 [Microgenomates group bacterium GW2011_GWE1_47_12]OGD71144.1 MAG: hypothetical protein A2187_02945 [Candidatus Collierbacteria bacterium RIFOXYA1_FULL_46_24]OGD74306.1 MAG: hypothetical protein A2228_02090 [Candidatus Collierbacteria bacterium RIFOXYA2_FULL_46_10]OGD85034.1 MAG: hypothetical protein A2618_01355 [Candidatus Collierbacteria bacterium 